MTEAAIEALKTELLRQKDAKDSNLDMVTFPRNKQNVAWIDGEVDLAAVVDVIAKAPAP